MAKQLIRSSAAVQRAMQPLYSCLPEELRCYRRAGPRVLPIVQQEKRSFDEVAADTDDACLTEVATLFRKSLDAYATAAESARRGAPDSVDKAISLSTKYELAYTTKLKECGFVEGQRAELIMRINRATVAAGRLIDRIIACERATCVITFAKELEAEGRKGTEVVDQYIRAFQAEYRDAPACIVDALGKYRSAFIAVETAAAALQRGDADTAGREGNRADELGVGAQEQLAQCVA